MVSYTSKGRNPVLPSNIYVPDGEAHMFGDRLFVYGSWDNNSREYCSTEYHVVSTKDMYTWDIGEKSLDGYDISWAADKKKKQYYILDMGLKNPTPFYRKMLRSMFIPIDFMPKFLRPNMINFSRFVKNVNFLFAPDCAYKNGKYYLYFCMADYSEGVAVSSNPNGPFVNPVRFPIAGIDPAVFVDDDGSAYYYWGQFRANAVKLNDDMVSFDEKNIIEHIVTEEEHGFHEGSSMRKRNGIYYYVYPCIYRHDKPTCLAYATSKSPLGPFEYKGIIIDNANCDPKSWNIHGSIEEFNGQWYVFYHRCSQNKKMYRRFCVEKIFFNEDGTINEVKMTSQGAGEPFKVNELIEGWRACEVAGGAYIDDKQLVMCNGSFAIIRYVYISEKGTYEIDSIGEGSVEIYANEEPIAKCKEGLYEIKIICKGNLIINHIVFK